jgi:hypothetical protein
MNSLVCRRRLGSEYFQWDRAIVGRVGVDASWLNQVDIWFAKIEREIIARGIFTSVPDLARKLRRYFATGWVKL